MSIKSLDFLVQERLSNPDVCCSDFASAVLNFEVVFPE